jgi:uncharacterized protein
MTIPTRPQNPPQKQDVANRSGPVRGLIRRAPLVSFLILSCLLSWWPGALQGVGVPFPGPPNTGVGPFLAVVLVLGVTRGRAGVVQLLRSMIRWRVPARAYVAGIGLPLLVSGSAILLTVMVGAARPSGSDLALGAQLPIVLLLVLVLPGTGGAWEEPGWRGFALGRFEKRYGVLAGPLLLGGFVVFWHAPLFVTGDILWPDILTIVAASVVVAAVYHAGKDSILIAMLFHATNNAVGGSFASQLFHGHDLTTLGIFTAAGWWLIAGAILLRSRHTRTSGEPS